MTAHKHLKQHIRARMEKTGESYASARRQVLRQAPTASLDPCARWHFPGNIPAATALRVLLAHAGIHSAHSGQPFSEALLFGIAGGIGAGVFSFLYEKEDAASFFIAGRHLWHDDLAYLRQACGQFGVEPIVRESSGARAAEKQLRETLAQGGPCIAWVDAAQFTHRALPAAFSGGGYHVITVYAINEQDMAIIGDLTDAPISVPLSELAQARARIKKQKNRLLALPPSKNSRDLADLVRAGLRLCQAGLLASPKKGNGSNFNLEAFRVWGERMHASRDPNSWERVFTRGHRLWRGLSSLYDYIENYGTGGGLCRPVFADFLTEAAGALGDANLRSLAERYTLLGRVWSELADAALPDGVPLLRETKEMHIRKAELRYSGGADAVAGMKLAWKRLDELEKQAGAQFPLSEAECADLRTALQQQILALYEGERAAHAAIAEAVA